MNLSTVKLQCKKEVLCGMALCLVHLICLKYFDHFAFMGTEGRRWIPALVSIFPLLFLYCFWRSFSDSKTAFIGAAGTEVLFSLAHFTKFKLTNEPLVWSDLVHLWTNSVLPKYMSLHHWLFLIGLAGWLTWSMGKRLTSLRLKSLLNGWSLSCLLFVPFIFFPKLNLLALDYNALDWGSNVQLNGLLFHLIQTTQKSPSLSYSEIDKNEFNQWLKRENVALKRPQKIIFILCESCWFDEGHFKDLFKPLFDRGFSSLRSISPVYGGGTPNATFEILTGLPSHNNYLKGVIYQEYASSLSERVHALPQYLQDAGYSTLALHNNSRTFWQRHIVNPKLGFETYLGLEEMPAPPSDDWPDDGVLFSVGLEQFNRFKNSPAFLYFTTIFTHGPYERRNDLGESAYRDKLRTSISRISYFIDEVTKADPDALIFIFGDHKPALSDYFTKEGIFKSEESTQEIAWDTIGDVPLLIKHSNSAKVQRVTTKANGLPFFCSIEMIDNEFIQSGLPVFSYIREMKLCENYTEKGYEYYRSAFPQWLFAISLFDKGNKRLSLKTQPDSSSTRRLRF